MTLILSVSFLSQYNKKVLHTGDNENVEVADNSQDPSTFALDVNPMFSGLSSLSPEPVHVIMASRDYWIPRYYIDSLSDSKVVEQKGILLFANLPDFTPRLEEKKDRSVAFRTIDRLIAVHIQDAEKIFRTFQGIYQLRRSYQPTLEYNKDIYGLRLELPDPKPPFNKDLYIEQNEFGKMISYIKCSRYGTASNPGCSHHFEYEGMFVKLSYRKVHLPQWQKLHEKGIAFIDSFTIPRVTKKQEGNPI